METTIECATGLDLMPHQQRWVDDKSRFRVWDCDRRLGATTSVALDIAQCEGAAIVVVASEREQLEFERVIVEFGLADVDVWVGLLEREQWPLDAPPARGVWEFMGQARGDSGTAEFVGKWTHVCDGLAEAIKRRS